MKDQRVEGTDGRKSKRVFRKRRNLVPQQLDVDEELFGGQGFPSRFLVSDHSPSGNFESRSRLNSTSLYSALTTTPQLPPRQMTKDFAHPALPIRVIRVIRGSILRLLRAFVTSW